MPMIDIELNIKPKGGNRHKPPPPPPEPRTTDRHPKPTPDVRYQPPPRPPGPRHAHVRPYMDEGGPVWGKWSVDFYNRNGQWVATDLGPMTKDEAEAGAAGNTEAIFRGMDRVTGCPVGPHPDPAFPAHFMATVWGIPSRGFLPMIVLAILAFLAGLSCPGCHNQAPPVMWSTDSETVEHPAQPVMDLIMDSSLGHQDTADALTAGARKGPFPWKVSRFTVGRIRRGQTHQDMVVIWRTENPGHPNLKRWTAS